MKYTSEPPGYTVDSATGSEMAPAGWPGYGEARKPGSAPASELLVEGETVTLAADEARSIMAEARFRVLRDPEGRIVATWDEGRWFTPEESQAYVQRLTEQLKRP